MKTCCWIRGIALSFSFVASLATGCELKVGVSGAFPPYHIQEAGDTWGGIALDIVNAMSSHMNCKVTHLNIPWDRALEMMHNGELDVLPYYTRTKQRAEYAHFVGPMEMEDIVVLTEIQNVPKLNTLQSLVAFDGLVGKTQGTFHGNRVEHAAKVLRKNDKLVSMAHNESRVGMLAAGRLDAIFENRVVAEYLLNTQTLDPKKYAVAMKESLGPVYFGLSKKSVSEALLKEFQAAWRTIVERGQLQKIYLKYGLKPPQEILTLQPPQ